MRVAIRLGLATLGFAVLSSCAFMTEDTATWEWSAIDTATRRAYAASYSETPFANGPMSVIATEGGHLRTYTLSPCRGGRTICAGGPRGSAGRLAVTLDHYVVSDIYGGRTFFLSPGGDGTLRRNGRDVPLAWDSIADQ